MSHYDAAIFTARCLEMCEIVEMTLFYFIDRPQVHSALSGLPFMVSTSMNSQVQESYTSLCLMWALQEILVLNEYTGSRLL